MSVEEHDGRRTGAATRQRILAVAMELFSTQGYAGTSIRDITLAMGMTKASLYYYFESKEQILEAVTEPLRLEMEELMARTVASPKPAPAELLTDLVDVLSRHALLLTTLFNDPSAFKGARHEHAKKYFHTIETSLAASANPPGDVLRARCAMGAVQAGVLGTVARDHREEPLRSDAALRLLEGKDHALDEEHRRGVVAAALRTLG